MDENVEATKRFSPADARALPLFEDDLHGAAQAVLPIFDMTAPDPRVKSLDDARALAKLGRLATRNRKHLNTLLSLFTSSAAQVLAERFDSEHVRAAMGWHAINDSASGPSTPGTAFVLLHDHASDASEAGVRQWGFVRGGMGVLTETMADAAREAGATIRCDAEVESVLTRGDRAVGVRLSQRGGDPVDTGAVERRPEADLPPAVRRRGAARGLRPRGRGLQLHGHEHQDQPRPLGAPPCQGPAERRCPAVPPRDRRGEPVHRRAGSAAGPGGVRHRGRELARRAVLPDGPRPVAGAARASTSRRST